MTDNNIEAFHTLARKYCIDILEECNKDWTNKVIEVYGRKRKCNYTDLKGLIKSSRIR